MGEKFSIHNSLSLRVFILSAVWLDVYSWSWFEAQSSCQLNGSTIRATTSRNGTFWTKYYKRRSHWIAVLGCSSEINLKNKSFIFDGSKIPSAGLCQELCLDQLRPNRIYLFALQKNECVCFNDNRMNLQRPFHTCKYDCVKDINERSNYVECGGDSDLSIFLSTPGEQDKDLSNSSCRAVDCSMKLSADSHRNVKDCLKPENISEENRVQDFFLKNPSNSFQSILNKACDGINSQHPAKTTVLIKRQTYLSYDRGLNLTSFKKRNSVGSCQQCHKDKGCLFLDCNEKTGDVVCKNGLVIPDIHSTQKPPTRKNTFHMTSRITDSENKLNKLTTAATNIISEIANTKVHSTQKHVTVKEMFYLTSHVTESEKRSNKITTTAGHGTSSIANKADGTTKKTVGIVASFLVICLLLVAGIVYMCRKKKLMKRERTRTSPSEGCRVKRRKIISETNDNQTKNSVSVLNMPKECLYELANNEIVQAVTSSNQETDGYGGMEDPYDHLRGTDHTTHEDDTYDHAPNVSEPSYSSLNINVGRNTNQSHVEESIYDHFED